MKNVISLAKFLSRYLNLTGKDLTKLKHEDVLYFFPELERTSFKYVRKHPVLLYVGQIVLVNDGRKTIPYKVPTLSVEDCQEIHNVSFVEDEKDDNDIDYNYIEMNNYSLRCLLRKKFNTALVRRCAKKELQKRGICLKKKYKRCEEKEKIRRDFND